ncbi:hypothetical protein [Paracidovorax konjaci]|uniref:Uncharacterized protein n=1 Tax=Paracidovorax konjaci TaxID=32040 RepID=A0A1I1XP23_9BURK|nr:hypothetical protein [Paracidovorax konjaci]SFE09086.1 hypothetical protein SAMN04489710_11428 [Paracidovorax konjaci]
MPIDWKRTLREGAVAGSWASALSTLALIWAGRRQARTALTPVNAVSHWLWGDPALREHRPRLISHTLPGYAIHHSASMFWAAASAVARDASGRPPEATWPAVCRRSAVTSAIACTVDFRLTPHRFTPGFEHHLDRSAIAAVYVAFGAGLAIGTAIALRRPPR